MLALLIAILNKFAKDTKPGNKVCNQQDIDALQKCLNDLVECSGAWNSMSRNVRSCILGSTTLRPSTPWMGSRSPRPQPKETSGVEVHSSLRPSVQCKEADQRANAILGQVTRSFHYRDKNICQLYMRCVRPHLEFATPVWEGILKTNKQWNNYFNKNIIVSFFSQILDDLRNAN